MGRWLGFGSILLAALALPASCGGLSQEDSELRCKQLRDADSACVTDAAYKACVSCYEDCGDSCKPSGKCPQTYSCDD